MKKMTFTIMGSFLLTLCTFPRFAFAHSISTASVGGVSGFLHPMQSIDHLLAMVALGVWAVQLRGAFVWQLPVTFVAIMGIGGVVGSFTFPIPDAENMILLSGVVLSVFAVQKIRFSTHFSLAIVAFFAFFHGYAHGLEVANAMNVWLYILGFMIATSLLHIVGIVLGNIALHKTKKPNVIASKTSPF